ncbi:putative colanic acid biosynthesis UDP-glucose lipid carrier transferase [Pontibacter ummariensis]|uniref:Putative colanic acid biosysnthesis UDP-glucose lipid carrier transferase n=1 Tax=Pontibacter ummariensis TaxID=1610492 RepID=A0A239ENT3_9BACT|nr:undecaprenyl-phosphate glucose phosphotransferase [Pontibacter ummariensis]PRY13329.1 putative colanic acid biosynthesis UDP-glucose lipid carrier transferase [Pontibacter ummariensis]SNS45592.1 putative colanic acid biosysnthesis UDP-glucose lipid carrier transferase [Pontibacter ummariensis]
MANRYTTFSKGLNLILDFLLLNLALYAGFVLHHPDLLGENITESYKLDFLLLNLVWFYCASVSKLYEDIFKRDAIPTIRVTLKSLFLYVLIANLLKLSIAQFDLPYIFIIGSFLLFTVLLLLWKTTFLLVRRPTRWSLIKYKRIVVVGAGTIGVDLYNYVKEHKNLGYEVVGFFDDHIPPGRSNKLVLGKVADCLDFVEQNYVDEVFCALPDIAREKIMMLMEESDKRMIRIKLVPDVKNYFKENFMVEMYGHLPILTPRREPLEDKANEIVKRSFDIVFSLLVTVFLLSWFIPLMALIIKLDSPGPVFFKQLRSGKDNRPFYCLKFRSMSVNSDSDSRQASKGDARITRVGAFIRKTSIDELPQFLNVLMGDMSVVGPRPHMLKHTEDYSTMIEKFMVRHFLTPGITGWAQVNGFRGETKDPQYMEKRVQADIWYLENWSFLLDLKIVVLTAWQAIRGDEKAF